MTMITLLPYPTVDLDVHDEEDNDNKNGKDGIKSIVDSEKDGFWLWNQFIDSANCKNEVMDKKKKREDEGRVR